MMTSLMKARALAVAALTILLLQFSPVSVYAQTNGQELYWDDELSQTFATFGPNQSVSIPWGRGGGICGGIVPVVHVYVVNVSSLADGDTVTDVSNPEHLPNTFLTFSGGLFEGQIGLTHPAGQLGPGTYGVVYKRCLDGKFHADEDAFFYPAFEVVIPANILALPPSFSPLKQFAEAAMPYWSKAKTVMEAYDKLQKLKAAIECLQNLVGCAVNYAVDSMIEYAKAQVMAALGLRDPKEAAKATAIDMFTHYAGIAADPPDPNYQQVTTLGPITRITEISDDPILQREFELANAAASHSAILAALLHAVERYQGAQLAGDSTWALVHARQIQEFSAALSAQLPSTNTAVANLRSAFAADTRDLDGLAAALGPMHAQIVSSGFNALQLQALSNLGASPALIANLRGSLTAEAPVTFNKAATLNDLDGLIATNNDLAAFLPTFISDIDVNIAALLAPPNFQGTRPFADAGGPYTAAEGASFALNGSASFEVGGAITGYAWDLDGDGQFDDAAGATPAVSMPSARDGFIGLQVSDAAGRTSVAYAPVTIADVNDAPVIDTATPVADQPQIIVGNNLAFTVTATDPDGDALSYKWLLDFAQVGAGLGSFLYAPAPGDVGVHTLRVEVSDGTAAGGTVTHEWSVSVLTADADGDGWHSNVDCNDGNPAVHPGQLEIIGNLIDDDCNAATLDGGTPPTAAFTAPGGVVAVGAPVTFTSTSSDPDSPVLGHAWTFGDGGSSTDANPTHVFASAGTFTVTLTVTDPQLFTSTVSHQVTVTHLPVAGFTFTPSPGIRTLPVTFTNTSTDADGALASYQWSFGDGGVSSNPNPSHIFDTAGTFLVQLIVTDADGATSMFSQDVTINPAPTDATSLKFAVIETNCGVGTVYRFKIGGVQVASITPAYDCDCNGATMTKTVTVTDPAILAMVSSPVCQVFTLETSAVYYLSSARAEITRPSGVQRIRIVNNNAGDGPDAYTAYACYAHYGGGSPTFQSALPNLDGDATPDCTDPDIDGDGVNNAGDNCPISANPTQTDFNGNGVGDACEDADGDTRLDAADNCPAVANTNQWDFDNDGTGNTCDTDADGDGHLNAADNCAFVSNADQADANSDGFGDACDIRELNIRVQKSSEGYQTPLRISIDGVLLGTLAAEPAGGFCGQPTKVLTFTDPETLALLGTTPSCNSFRLQGDYYTYVSWAKAEMTHHSGTVETVVIHDVTGGVFQNYACYGFYHAPNFANATPDTDSDGVYNCEDPDMDGDGDLNAADNCPLVSNPNQEDVDGNGIGNACQDTDADAVLDINDNCPLVSNQNQANIDGDSMGDVCDPDRDNDTVLNVADNCPNNPNTDQADLDLDGTGDVCDSDVDGDSVQNGSDNCQTTPNTDQLNTDGDSVGDVCDPDKDNDGVLNAADNCELRVNAGQESTNPFGVGDVCVPIPVTVPWLGVPTQPHQVYSGGKLVLQGVAIYDGDYAPAQLTSATWDPGDGSDPVDVSVANPYALELEHTYTGAPGTPYFATLTIRFGNNQTRSDIFRVLIQPRTLDVEANMAIDRGLWNLHKSQSRYTQAGHQASQWAAPHDPANVAATSATLNAFGINNHRINGDRLEDPYVEDVRRGFVHLEANLFQSAISVQPAGNPDTNGNGIALHTHQQIYQSGQVAEAFIAAGQQTSVAVVGVAAGRTFRDIVQDIMDGYWFGQVDPGPGARGGWHYGWNYGSADNSTAQWGAITGLAGENAWQIPVPSWVKTENRDYWMRFSQRYDNSFWHGTFGYGDSNCAWSNCMSTTPSGMVQLIFDGVHNDPSAATEFEQRYQAAKTFLAKAMRNGYHLADPSFGGTNYYSLFAMAKAFRLATMDDGSGNAVPNPVTLIDDNPSDALQPFDWYRSDPAAGETAPLGVARLLISRQLAGGNWQDFGYWGGSLATAYSVIILSPTIFELGPAAMCAAVPSVIAAGGTVTLDGSGSVHNDPFGTIESYTWDFLDGSSPVTIAAPNSSTTHTFASLGTYNVVLTVTDQNGITASASCPVQVIDGNLPPSANAGGPYNFCAGAPMILDASQSVDPEGSALSYAWDLSLPLNFTPIDSNLASFDASSAFAGAAPGTYQIALRVTDAEGHSTAVFPNITIHAASDPAFCNTPPELTVPADITTPATSAAGAAVTFMATANDAGDGPLTPSCTPASGATFAIGTTNVSCSVTDSGGLTVTKSFNVTVLNNPPTFTPPDDIITSATSTAGATVNFVANGNDIENGVIAAVCMPASGSTFAIGTTQVDCTVTDNDGLSASGSFTVTVINNGPTFTPPANIVTPATSAAGATVNFIATGNDLENGVIAAVCMPASGSTFAIGTTQVDCTVTDNNGLTASGSFTVTVTNNPPTFTPPANIVTPATSAAGATVNFVASGNDIENGVIAAVCMPASGSTFAIGTTQVDCTVTDNNGSSASGSFTVTVTNNAPAFTPPDNITTPATSAAGATVNFTANGSDLENGVIPAVCVPASGSTFPIGTTQVDCTVTDSDGLSAAGSFTVTVTNNGPSFTPPADITTPATSAAGAAVTFVANGSDLENGVIPAVCVPASGSTFPIGTTQVDCTVTDNNGLSASGSFTVTVTNNAPTFTPPANITTPATSAAGAPVTFVANGSDLENGVIPAVCVPASGSTFPIGTTQVDCTVTDTNGSSASGSFTVTVTNNAPTFTPPANITTPATSAAGAPVSFVANGSDLENGVIAAVCVPASGSTFPIGTTQVDCTVTDNNGSSATGSFTVTVINNAPTFTPPLNIVTSAPTAAGIAVNFTAAGNDVENGVIPAVCMPPSGSTFPIGTTTVNCTVTDAHGATAAGSFTVTVTLGNSAPVCSATPSVPMLSWPPNHRMVPITLDGITDPDGNPFNVTITLIAQDEPTNTQGDGNTPSDAAGVGTSTAQVRAERSGTPKVPGNGRVYHIFYTATDSAGASCTGKVLVGVPHDRGGMSVPIDDGPKFNSLTGAKLP
jgi:PKD repeat protein